MATLVFLDTNVFLHYQDFDQIKWSEIIGVDSITIVIPPIIIRELNKLKDSNNYSKKIKTRASKTLNKLGVLFSSDCKAMINNGLEIILEDRDPSIDFHAHNLSREVNDDHLIASIIMCREENPNSLLILVTSDSGLTLTAKARRHEIKTVKLNNNLKLKEEPDQDQEKIKELRQELDKIKQTIPNLSLVFENDTQHTFFTLEKPTELTMEEIEVRIAELKKQFPKISGKPEDSLENKIEALEGFSASLARMIEDPFTTISSEDIYKYNADLDKFIEEYRDHLVLNNDYENRILRTICLDIFVVNNGTAPAKDIDIIMNFPSGLSLIGKRPTPLIAPQPPEKPKPQMGSLLGGYNSFPAIFNLPPEHPNFPQSPSNVSSLKIIRTNGNLVNVHVDNLKHGLIEKMDSLYIIFNSYEAACPFQIEYKLLAANVPQAVKGKLHVVINK